MLLAFITERDKFMVNATLSFFLPSSRKKIKDTLKDNLRLKDI